MNPRNAPREKVSINPANWTNASIQTGHHRGRTMAIPRVNRMVSMCWKGTLLRASRSAMLTPPVNMATLPPLSVRVTQQQGEAGILGNGVTLPRILREVKPAYTSDAMRAKVQGTVLLQCVVRPDGSVRHTRASTAMLFDASGMVRRAVGCILDLTESMEAEARLRGTAVKLAAAGRSAGVTTDIT